MADIPVINVDAYIPSEMAKRVEAVGISKANLFGLNMFLLAILAGVFIGFGAWISTVVTSDSNLSFGLTRLLAGLVFCLGLILVVVAGAELFTGNNLIIMAFASKKIGIGLLLKNWLIVYIGNLFGSLSLVYLVYYSKAWSFGNNVVGGRAILIANSKVNLGFIEALILGILCNALVCLAIWLCFSARSVTDKILAILFPITTFVAAGFEHSVANMFFIPMGILLTNQPKAVEAADLLAKKATGLDNLNILGFIKNLVPVTLGNIIGGAILVGFIYWFIYIRPAKYPIIKTRSKKP
jgi:formate/nitrite transporter